ncbi:DUF4249 domain-containing protein [Aquimarina sp. ERC-38]|uniref:DUF4249 domain-containing protein n=1 Tax=Aquimarina sp. ERC-38 TaxID=2949996 RepID=UPI002247473C|nr:DUF4249 domain-containing protein [Aquimarina sp. ERC-38]UZO79787.1 DUF4249 domain-containing protein [Aquimarina sp. ERC-38]
MKKIKRIHIIFRYSVMTLLSIFLKGCIETVPLETEGYEDIIVIEALLTDEFKEQEIQISRSYRFEDSLAVKETGAEVRVVDDAQRTFTFLEASPGIYKSTEAFSPSQDRTYQLQISTTDGRSYRSDFVNVEPPASLERVYAERTITDNDFEGIGIFVDSEGFSDQPGYFRYEYEETFVLESPFWSRFLIVPPNEPSIDISKKVQSIEFDLKPKDFEDRICYRTEASNSLILTDTENQTNNNVEGFRVRFVEMGDYRLRDRFSINVTQISQSRDTYRFYELLNNFSASENIFSQIQPGFIEGNIVSDSNSDEQVLGLFTISSVSSKRIFLNFKDFFPEAPLPDYIASCTPDTNYRPNLPVISMEIEETPSDLDNLLTAILGNIEFFMRSTELRYFFTSALVDEQPMPRFVISNIPIMVPNECADCRIFGSNIRPDFWED